MTLNPLRIYAAVKAAIKEPATGRRSQVGMRHEPPNVSAGITVATIQGYIRNAENGETRELFSLYRDIAISGSHVQAEFSKRKLAVLGQPWSVIPADKDNAEDVKAADAVKQMIGDCENWTVALTHLLDASLWPVAVVEKLYRPADNAGASRIKLQYTLRRLEPINPALLCFKQPYTTNGTNGTNGKPPETLAPLTSPLAPPFEPDVRFYITDADNRINYNYDSTYPAEPDRHLFHRGHLLASVRDNWGGPYRAILFWWLLSTLGRDWFGRGMERWGAPFPVGHTDASNPDAVALLQDAFKLSTTIGGLVVDHETQVELKEIAASNMADAFEKFISVCNREISKIIVGQTLSAEAQSTGLGSSVGKLQGEVRDDIRLFDQLMLGETLGRALFRPFLDLNGLKGATPKIVWGSVSPEEITSLADLLVKLSQASLEPTDDAMPLLSEKIGFELQRKEMAAPTAGAVGQASRLSPLMTFTADQLGVPVTWLTPVRRHLDNIEAKLRDNTMSDDDLQQFLAVATRRVPELFGKMDIDGLSEIFEAGMSEAVIDGVRAGVKKLGPAAAQ